ncbi:MAG: 30S ribosomal protein S4 [Nitrospirota bacterium]
MARYIGPLCRLCRRENSKLFLKGERCFKDKCALERRNYPPGQHGQGRIKVSDYGLQLREKQKLSRIYGLLERQFRNYFEKAERMEGITGENLLQLLERRLDNVVYRLGFASSRNEARQMVRHGHFIINGKKVNIPSFLLHQDDVIELSEKSRKIQKIADSISNVEAKGIPSWLQLEKENLRGHIIHLPTKDEIILPVQEQIVVEFYSKL